MHYSVEETKTLIIFVVLAKLMSSHGALGFIANISRPFTCQGSTATVDFDFNLEGESIVSGSKVWLFNRISIAEDTGTGFTALNNYTSRLTSHSSDGLTLSSVTTADSGTYEYEILLGTGFTPRTATASLTVYIGPLGPPSPSGCSVDTSQSGKTVTCTIKGNCGTPPLNPSWVNFTTTSNQFKCTDKRKYQCCATSAASTSCYSGSPNDFCTLFDCSTIPPPANGTLAEDCSLGLALGVGLGNAAICIICFIFIVILVKIVDIQDKHELQKPIPRGSDVTITASVRGFYSLSVQWIGPHGNISVTNDMQFDKKTQKISKGKYNIQYDSKTGLSTLQITNLERNDSGVYTCCARCSCGPSAQDSVTITVHVATGPDTEATGPDTDATGPNKCAIKFILGLLFIIIDGACIGCIVILVKIGKPCDIELGLGLGLGIPVVGYIIFILILLIKGELSALKLVLWLGLGLVIPIVGCIIFILIPFKTVLKPTPAPKNGQEKTGSRSDVSRRDVELQMEEKGVKNNEERPLVIHNKIGNKDESEIEHVQSKPFDPKERRPLPVVNQELKDKPNHRPQPIPSEKNDVKDQNLRGLSANFDDTRGLASEMQRRITLPPIQQQVQSTVQEEGTSEEPKNKKKNRKKKDKTDEGKSADEIAK